MRGACSVVARATHVTAPTTHPHQSSLPAGPRAKRPRGLHLAACASFAVASANARAALDSGMQTDVKVVKETATPDGATLSLEAIDRDKKPLVSSVDIVKESGAWKIAAAVEQRKPKGN